ncbi:MAG: immune inhibitor A [Polyangiaceae bacterium]
MNVRLLAIPFSVALLAGIAGCAGGTVETVPEDDDGTGGGGVGGMATGGMNEGGDGGDNTSLCEMDCSAINAPPCNVAVCNEGDYPGTIGECVVVADENGTTCDDGVFCTVGDACMDGACVGGPPNDCGLAVGPCEEVTCDEGSQTCSSMAANNGSACTPTDLCQINGQCTNGNCVGQPKDCLFAPKGDCEVSVCNPADGMCTPEPDPSLDGQSCIDPNDLCSDGNTCGNGVCSGGFPKDCSALDVGCTVGVCDAVSGQCTGMAVPAGGTCFDGIGPCETGTCDASMNCVPSPVPNGTACDDFSNCTTGDTCNGGVCSGTLDPMCSTYLQEAFETCPPPGWALNPEWECGAPSMVGPATAFQGTGLLGTDLDSTYENNSDYTTSYAQTPPIGLGTATAPLLSYWHYVDTEGSSFDGYNIKVSTDGGMTFNVLTTVDPPYPLTVNSQPAYGGAVAMWEQVTADLSAFVGQQIILRFSFRSDGSVQDPGVYIDDLLVIEGDQVPVTITTPSFSDAFENVLYGQSVATTGGSGMGTWSIQPGGVNDGWLSIDSAGVLSGTATAANLGPVTVTVRYEEPTNPSNFDEATFSFNVISVVFGDHLEAACPGIWTLGGDWQCGTPTSGPGAAFGGTQLLATQLAGNYTSNQAWATTTASSGAISLAGTTAPLLRFRVWYDTEGSTFDGFNVKVSTDGGMTYAILPMVTPAYNLTVDGQSAWGGSNGTMWQEYTADLTSFAGQSVNIQFGFRSDGSVQDPGVYIDDVAITD